MYKKRKIWCITFIIGMIIFCRTPIVLADEMDEDLEEFSWEDIQRALTEENEQTVSGTAVKDPVINARAAVIYDRETKKVIWGKKENEKRAMASTTKIMTAIVVLEHADLQQQVTISKKAASTGGSLLKMRTGDKITIQDLLYGLLLRSGNDAAVALAEQVGESLEGFAILMNQKAEELGLSNTNFVTPHGLDNPEHYTTALELAKLTDYALQNEKFAQMVGSKTYTITINGIARTLNNTNELLGNLNGVNGVKTGFTGNAMRCLVTSCKRNGNEIITVVLGADTKKQRTTDSIKLIEYAFQNYDRIDLEKMVEEEFENWKEINSKRIKINKAKDMSVTFQLEEMEYKKVPILKGEEKEIQIQINAIYEYEAPIIEKQKIGNIVIKKGEETIETIDILAKTEIPKKNIWDYFIELLSITKYIL